MDSNENMAKEKIIISNALAQGRQAGLSILNVIVTLPNCSHISGFRLYCAKACLFFAEGRGANRRSNPSQVFLIEGSHDIYQLGPFPKRKRYINVNPLICSALIGKIHIRTLDKTDLTCDHEILHIHINWESLCNQPLILCFSSSLKNEAAT